MKAYHDESYTLKKKCYFCLHWVFVAVRGLSVVADSGGYSLVMAHRLWIAVVSPVAEQGI